MRINVIGVGHWGPNIVSSLNGIKLVEVGMVADLSTDRLRLIKEHFEDVEITEDPDAAINDPKAEAVAIATPLETHHALVTAALQAGKHVFVEKPVTRTVAQAEELAALAADKKRVLMIGHVFLFNAGIRAVKKLIDDGELGNILYVDATRTNLGPMRKGTNAFWDLASHDISIFQYWLGTKAEGVTATGASVFGTDTEDVVFGTIRYPGDIQAHVHASWVNPQKVRQITVVGDKKMVVWDDMDLNRAVSLYDRRIDLNYENMIFDYEHFRAEYHMGNVTLMNIPGTPPLKTECAHFVDCIVQGIPCVSGPEVGIEVVKILEAADCSLATESRFVSIN